MEIKEVGQKITKGFGKNGKYIVLGLGGVILLLLLTNKNNTENSGEWVTPTGYTSYPDAVTNANVIMNEVNKHTTAEVQNLQDSMDLQFGITSDFMGEGIDKIIQNAEANKDQIVNQIVTSEGNVKQNVKETLETVQKADTENNVSDVKQSETTQKAETDQASYYEKTSYKGVSLVDGLKAVGVYTLDGLNIGNWQSRVNLAKLNGIANYTGTAIQNSKLLSLLKQGKLKKA